MKNRRLKIEEIIDNVFYVILNQLDHMIVQVFLPFIQHVVLYCNDAMLIHFVDNRWPSLVMSHASKTIEILDHPIRKNGSYSQWERNTNCSCCSRSVQPRPSFSLLAALCGLMALFVFKLLPIMDTIDCIPAVLLFKLIRMYFLLQHTKIRSF